MVTSDDGAQLARVLLSRVVIYQVPSLLVYATALVWTVWLGRSITRAT